MRATSKNQSAGLLLFRERGGKLEFLLGHPGGPFWRHKDQGAWTIPKGLMTTGESAILAAQREFAEETGYLPAGELVPLGNARQSGGKLVHVWAAQDNWDPAELRSNTFELEWPPRSGRRLSFPEIDRAAWFDVNEARIKILKGQAVFIDRLLEIRRIRRQRPIASRLARPRAR